MHTLNRACNTPRCCLLVFWTLCLPVLGDVDVQWDCGEEAVAGDVLKVKDVPEGEEECMQLCAMTESCTVVQIGPADRCTLFMGGNTAVTGRVCSMHHHRGAQTEQDTAPEDGAVSGVRWCSSNEQCRANGDTGATCDQQARCQCGTGYSNPVSRGQTQYTCHPVGTNPESVRLRVLFTFVFPSGSCTVFRSRPDYARKTISIIERVYGRRIRRYTIVCGSVHMLVSMDDVTLPELSEDITSEIQSAVVGDPDLGSVLGTEVTTETAVDTGAGAGCTVPNAVSAVSVEVRDRTVCSALECLPGFSKTEGPNGESTCVDSNTVSVQCLIDQDCSDANAVCSEGRCFISAEQTRMQDRSTEDSSNTGMVVLIIVLAVAIAAGVAAAVFLATRRSGRDDDAEAGTSSRADTRRGGKESDYDQSYYYSDATDYYDQSPSSSTAGDVVV